MLVKFKVASVEETSYDQKYYKGLDLKKEYHETRYNYYILGTDGITYLLQRHPSSVLGLVKGKTLYAFVRKILKPNSFFEHEPNKLEIKYYNSDRPGLMTPQKFAIEVKKEIEDLTKRLSSSEEEIRRLESLSA